MNTKSDPYINEKEINIFEVIDNTLDPSIKNRLSNVLSNKISGIGDISLFKIRSIYNL
jgi:hypothetical protein